MTDVILNNLPLWTSALKHKSAAGRGSRSKLELTGIKKLRELILELAVRGQLVPQDPNDEPASELLKRIAAEKAELVKAGKLKKQKPLPEITEEEKPFALPMGWEWVRLGEISQYIQRGKSPDYSDSGTVRVVSQKCVQWFGFDLASSRFISEVSVDKYTPERFLQNRDVLWNSTGTGTVGRVISLINVDHLKLVADSHVTIVRPVLCESNFLTAYIRTPGVQDRMNPEHEFPLVSGTTKQVELNTSTIEVFIIPVPPLVEQQRIVAKVDKLMALCDQLEQQTENHTGAHQQLVETLLATLTNAQSADELDANWARLAAHFDLLFAGPMGSWAVDRLKDTILQLAVQGRLVPQNPFEEPASALLARIEAEKAELIKQGKLKKQKPLPPISDDEKPFELPQGWEWVRFDNLILGSDAGWSPQCEPSPRVDEGWGVLKVSAVTWGEYRPEENKALPVHLQPKKEYEVVAGDFLISRANTAELVARSVVVPDTPPPNLMMSDKIIRLRLSDLVNRYFINLINGSGYARNYYLTVAGGTSSSMKNVSRAQIHELVIALPPQSEQTRIVEKVDQLFALCDQLKAKLEAANTTQLQLTEAVVEHSLTRH